MPNWFLLVDALRGAPRNDWERFAGPTWADDALEYAKRLAAAATWRCPGSSARPSESR
jgi:hypothetical protein